MNKIGIDIIEIKRLRNWKKLFKKILHEDEIKIFQKFNTKKRKNEFLAGRWAAKEALMKILNKDITMNLINIGYKNNKPVFLNEGYENYNISISHETKYCVAVAIDLDFKEA
ncbi:holo-[acyl-carrier-protein] synthase [Spiroplasma litorale]|uniref:Holo-[acyl-carrier-protein] synthase n=1 Tax=Spiroplasma litorale TaxID=216942 RepID=A0A0K1W0S6_9MOLU|nr:4'-phosphopantetheinyl transferase superfamily protein [Spiroplasma litorale]AKX33924.1 holo-[acyl-carrier-protein] synthase [Spiroplasma litorale]